ncbi:MAG: alkaline phosphatase family protein, partial [Gammaproteobacteria bacterium]|nr:alkaline phosphatase family protein [Gammaproteobacteria bacterium]
RHGQYDGTRFFDALRYHDGKYAPEMLYPTPIWAVLSEAGKRVAIIDAPYRYLSENLNGIDIHDWGTHAPTGKNSFAHFKTNPPELAREIAERFGLDPLKGAMCDKIRPRSLNEQRKFRDDMVDRARQRALMSEYFIAMEDWDFVLTVFSECHCIGHHAWHIHDPSHPDHDPAIASELGDSTLDVYKAVDQSVGEILERAGPNTTAVVYCSHGMGARYSGSKLLDKILVCLDGLEADVSSPLTRAMRTAWRSLPMGLRNSMKPTQAKLHKKIYHDGFQGNRAGRRFFEILTNDRTAGVRINLVGREPNGKVAPGKEYGAVCQELEEKLLRIVNADSGLPLVKEIHRTSDIYHGERRDQLPDLLVTWNQVDGSLERVFSPDIGEMRHENLSFRTGDHRPYGIFFAEGPSINRRGDIGSVTAMDFAPTFAGFFGITLPATDGKAIPIFAHANVDDVQIKPLPEQT